MKNKLIEAGNLIAILLMFGPVIIVCHADSLKNIDFVFLLICSILYDMYMYSNILKSEYIKKLEERYSKHIKPNKILGVDISDKEHMKIYENFVEEILNNLR